MPTNHAEQYELPAFPSSPEAGPSRLPRPQRRRASTWTKSRTLTLHPTTSAANLLFSAPSGAFPATRQRHGRTRPQSNTDQSEEPRLHRATFLSEDPYDDSEEVDLPDFGHILGFNDEGEDHFAVASGMRTRWKRKLYLLMEEPASGREAFFVHIIVTGAIIFRQVHIFAVAYLNNPYPACIARYLQLYPPCLRSIWNPLSSRPFSVLTPLLSFFSPLNTLRDH